MKVLVLGGGVIGVCSAWYLNRAGHDVTVIEREDGCALETSFANAGQVSFGYTTPWAAPGLMLKALKWMLKPHSPLIIRPEPSFAMLKWMISMLRNCSEEKYKKNKALMVRVSDYSALCLAQLRQQTNIHYDERMEGTIQLFRSHAQLHAAQKDIEVLKADGINFQLLSGEQCIAREPGLAGVRDQIIAGLQTPDDETGDCQLFTTKLAAKAAAAGVDFKFNTTVKRFHTDGTTIRNVETSNGMESADCYLSCLGAFSPFLLNAIGVKVPIYPVKGYSITMPIKDNTKAPRSTVIDDTYKIAITRLGTRIRVGGMAELSGYERRLPEGRRDTLLKVLHLLFKGASDEDERPALWCGLRPVTPDSVPIIGKTTFQNLFTNTGHGTLGWTMASGSGKLVADLISGSTPDIDPNQLDITRYLP